MQRALTLAALPAALLLSACQADGVDGFAPGASADEQSVIYGADDRLDHYQITGDPMLLALSNATAGIVSSSQVTDLSGPTTRISTSTWGPSGGYCSSEPFWSQPEAPWCSAFLVGPDLVATAGHCISSCGSQRFVFGFRMDGPSSSRTTVSDDDVYSCSQVIQSRTSGGYDHAVIRLDRAVVGRTPLAVRGSGTPSVGTDLVVAGHPSGLPVKIAGGAEIKSIGSVSFEANLDTYGGNSGSPVINANTGVVEGILVNGETDYVWTGSCYESNQCSDGSGCGGGFEGVSRASGWVGLLGGGSGGTCTDDGYEQDDTRGAATLVSDGSYSLTVCDDDWFAIQLSAGETIDASIFFSHGVGDLDLELVDSSGSVVDDSTSTSDSESVSATASGATTVYVRVYGYSGATGDYTLDIQTSGGTGGCTADAYEPNDSLGDAADLGDGFYAGLTTCSGNDDYYAIDLTAGQSLDVDVLFSHALGDVDARLYDASGAELDRGTSTTDDEALSHTASSAETVFLRVYGYDGATNDYDLDVTISGGAPPAAPALAGSGTAFAGSAYSWTATDFSAGTEVYLVYGGAGSTAVPGCPGLTLGVGSPTVLAAGIANGSGDWTHTMTIPGSAQGFTSTFYAVSLDACEVSNPLPTTIF